MIVTLNFIQDDFNGYYTDCINCAITKCLRRHGFRLYDTGNTLSLINHAAGKMQNICRTPKELTEKVLMAYENLSKQTFSYAIELPDDVPRV